MGFRKTLESIIAAGLISLLPAKVSATNDADVVADWAFEESGTELVDSSGNGHTGTIHNVERAAGVEGNALSLNGTNSFAEIPDDGQLSGLPNLTASCWFKANSFNTNGSTLLSKCSDTDPDKSYDLGVKSLGSGLVELSARVTNGKFLWASNGNLMKIYKMTTDGNVITNFNAPGTCAVGLAFDGKDLWVVNQSGGPIYQMNTSGKVIKTITTPLGSLGLAYSGSNLWSSVESDRKIYQYTKSGTVVSSFIGPGNSFGAFAWDGESLWFSDYMASKLYKLRTNGSVIKQFNNLGTLHGLTFEPNLEQITFTTNLILTNQWNHAGFSYGDDTLSLYLNGERVASLPYTNVPNRNILTPLRIGSANEANFFNGLIDRVKLQSSVQQPNGDTDNDDAPDLWEVINFGKIDAPDDYDHDGMSNADEYHTGTAPTNSSSVLRIEELGPLTGEYFTINWPCVDGKLYHIEKSTNMLNGHWLLVSNFLADENGQSSFKDPINHFGPCYYRIKVHKAD